MIDFSRKLYSETLNYIKKNYKPGTLEYLAALVNSFDNYKCLSHEKISLPDYGRLVEIMKDMADSGGGVDFISGSLKAFFERHGFAVRTRENAVGFYVSCLDVPGNGGRAMKMTAQGAKELSLQIWGYLAGHPDIRHKSDLPGWLFVQIEHMVLNCPLCELFIQNVGFNFTCSCCPLISCNTDGSLYNNWARSATREEREYHARRVLGAIGSWDAGNTSGQ